jgi:hypothetical protein
MALHHIDGTNVSDEEVNDRILADNLLWLMQLLKHDSTSAGVGDILSVADDALHYGSSIGAKKPYRTAVHDFQARHPDEVDRLMKRDIIQDLVIDFTARISPILRSTSHMSASESIESVDVHVRQYMAEIAKRIHRVRWLSSQKRGEQIPLQQAREGVSSRIYARVFSQTSLTAVRSFTSVPVINEDGSFGGRDHDNMVFLDVGDLGKDPYLRLPTVSERSSSASGVRRLFLYRHSGGA